MNNKTNTLNTNKFLEKKKLEENYIGDVPLGLKLNSINLDTKKSGGGGGGDLENNHFAKQIYNSVNFGSMKELPEYIFDFLVKKVVIDKKPE